MNNETRVSAAKAARQQIKAAYPECNIKIRLRRMDIMISVISSPYSVSNSDGYFQLHDIYPKETANYRELTPKGKSLIDGICDILNSLDMDKWSPMIEYGSSKHLFSCND